MKLFDEVIRQSASARIDEIKDIEGVSESVSDFYNELGDDLKAKFLEVESLAEKAAAEREEKIYLQGMKDGAKLYSFLMKQ